MSTAQRSKLRFGLCCQFQCEPIRFCDTTAAAAARLSRAERLQKISQLCLANADATLASLEYCRAQGIGCFRLRCQVLPLKTHPQLGYDVSDLPDGDEVIKRFRACGRFGRRHAIRTAFHPDQFVVLNSLRPEVVGQSIAELEYQAEVAEWVGADVINVHGGGAFGDKSAAIDRFAAALDRLSARVRRRLTVENDDRLFTPADLLPMCRREGVPLVYDVHHHRCHADGLSIEQATQLAADTWNREPLVHISSPREGWQGRQPRPHHDYIDPADFPEAWLGRRMTVEVEARAKELAVLKLMQHLESLPPARAPRRTMGRRARRAPKD